MTLGGTGLTTSTDGGSYWGPTVQSIVETHEPLFKMMVSYALPHTSSAIQRVFQLALRAKVANNQVPVIGRLVKITSSLKNWDQPIGDKEPLDVELPLGVAKALDAFKAPIGDISEVNISGDKFVMTVKGPVGISVLQGRLSMFLRKRFPEFNIPFGGDTEVLFNPSSPKYNLNA